jgi:hypothetical protein
MPAPFPYPSDKLIMAEAVAKAIGEMGSLVKMSRHRKPISGKVYRLLFEREHCYAPESDKTFPVRFLARWKTWAMVRSGDKHPPFVVRLKHILTSAGWRDDFPADPNEDEIPDKITPAIPDTEIIPKEVREAREPSNL